MQRYRPIAHPASTSRKITSSLHGWVVGLALPSLRRGPESAEVPCGPDHSGSEPMGTSSYCAPGLSKGKVSRALAGPPRSFLPTLLSAGPQHSQPCHSKLGGPSSPVPKPGNSEMTGSNAISFLSPRTAFVSRDYSRHHFQSSNLFTDFSQFPHFKGQHTGLTHHCETRKYTFLKQDGKTKAFMQRFIPSGHLGGSVG